MKSTAIVLSLAVAVMVAFAAPASAGTEITLKTKIKRVQVGLSSGATVYPEAVMTDLDCVPGNNYTMLLDYGHARYKDIYAMILAAKSSGQEMTFRIQSGSTGCLINYVLLE